MNETSPQPSSELQSEKALARAFGFFLHKNKSLIGLSKSEHFNNSVLAIALRDQWARGLLGDLPERLAQAGQKSEGIPAKNPELAMYLRGAKQTLALLLTSLRKSFFSTFGQEILTVFDSLGEKAPSVSSEAFGRSYWAYFARKLAQKHTAFIEAAVMGETVLPCFADLRSAVEGSVTAGKDEIESGTINFSFKRETEVSELLHLLHDDYALPSAEQRGELDISVADYVEARERLLSTFQQRPVTLSRVRDLVCAVTSADQPKKGESIIDKRKRAAKLYSSVVDLACGGAGEFDLTMSKKTPDKRCPEAEAEFKTVHAEVSGYVRGVLAAADALLLGEVRGLAETLGLVKAYDDTVLTAMPDGLLICRFFENAMVDAVSAGIESRLRKLIQGLRNEGVVKDFNDSSLHVGMKGSALIVQISLMLSKHGPYVRRAGLLISVSPALEEELARCPSLVEPLTHLLAIWQKKDAAAATKMIGDPAIARTLGEVILMDYAFKALMLSDQTFLSFLLGNLREAGFLAFVGLLAGANQKIRRLAMADPRILRSIWLVEKKYPGIGFAAAILSRPMELQSLADSLNDPAGVTPFIKKFITALRQETPPAAS